MAGFDWPSLMRAGMRGLGLKPWEFWALTPAELQLMLGEGGGSKPMDHDRLTELMAAFPDDTRGDGT
ncbi:phage tail assembly chaperone [Mameliella alba]|nr:phage tail assembly chaperone [Antarctobacter heliothermus]MBY6145702.1 phage tail assembly chaperone [Mameliella alba]MCA0954881.1 phage tail assembly chaperone [Mameliella alba]